MTRIKKITQHSEEIEVHEPRPIAKQKRMVHQHFLKRQQSPLQLCQHFLFLRAPLVEAAAPKLALFMAQKPKPVAGGHHFPPVDIVEPESGAFDFTFDITPED